MTTFAQMIADPDVDRVLLCEMRPKKELNTLFWQAAESGLRWTDWPYFPVYEVKSETKTYTKTTSKVDCEAATESWFHDTANGWLYVHTTDWTPPGYYGDLFFATVMIPISSGATDAPVAYIPEGMDSAQLYLPFLDAAGVNVTQEVESFETGGLTLSSGGLSILNDGSAYYWEQDYIWDYADFALKMGPTGEAYSAFETIFIGKLLNSRISDAALSFTVVSPLVELNEDIVATKFTTAAYPNMDPNADGRPQPWIFGIVSGIVPTCIETLTFIYRVACHACEEISGVYKDGVLLTLTTDYTVAGDNSEFTLLADPGDAEIRCTVKGAKVNQAVNLIKYSEAYGNSAWGGLTYVYGVYFKPPITSTNNLDPYGGLTAYEFASYDPSPAPYDATFDYISGIYQSFANSGTTYTVGVTYTVSIWARCTSGTLDVNFGFDEVQFQAFTLTTTWQRLTYTAAWVNNGLTKNIYIAEHADDNVPWQIAYAQSVQSAALTRYTKTVSTIKTADAYSDKTADILAYFLSGNGPVSKAYTLDVEGINELLVRRPEFIGWQIYDVQKGMDFLGVLMRTSAFQLTPMLDGSIKPFIYKTTIDSDALRIDGPDMKSCVKFRDTTATRQAIICKYNYEQYLGAFKGSKAVTDDDIDDRYGAKDYLEIETAQLVGIYAQTIGEYLLEMYKQPPTIVELKVGAIAMDLVPGDQIVLNKTVIRPLGG